MGGVEAGSKIFLGNVFRKGNRRSDPAVFLSLHFPPGLERPFYISVFPRRTFVLYFRIPTSNVRSIFPYSHVERSFYISVFPRRTFVLYFRYPVNGGTIAEPEKSVK